MWILTTGYAILTFLLGTVREPPTDFLVDSYVIKWQKMIKFAAVHCIIPRLLATAEAAQADRDQVTANA